MRFLFLLSICSLGLVAQESTRPVIVISAAAGFGTTYWFSRAPYADFDGGGTTVPVDLAVVGQLNRFHAGLAYGYEHLSISALSNRGNPGSTSLAFQDSRVLFNKFSVIGGYTLASHERHALTTFLEMGFYRLDKNYSQKLVAHQFFGAISLDLSMRVTDRSFVFVQPEAEFKYFDLSGSGSSIDIDHRILSFTCRAGVRYRIF